MKYLMHFLSLGSFLFLAVQVQAQHEHSGSNHHATEEKVIGSVSDSTETFVVYGNCGMCKRRIEGSLTEVLGVHSAEWNSDTKVISVNYDATITSLDHMKKEIARVGHDTNEYRAKKQVYENLPGCCQYQRPKD